MCSLTIECRSYVMSRHPHISHCPWATNAYIHRLYIEYTHIHYTYIHTYSYIHSHIATAPEPSTSVYIDYTHIHYTYIHTYCYIHSHIATIHRLHTHTLYIGVYIGYTHIHYTYMHTYWYVHSHLRHLTESTNCREVEGRVTTLRCVVHAHAVL